MIHVSITLYKGLLLYALKKRKEKLKLKVVHVFFLVCEAWVDLEQIQDTFDVLPKAGMMLECFSISF